MTITCSECSHLICADKPWCEQKIIMIPYPFDPIDCKHFVEDCESENARVIYTEEEENE